jgi:hypothetical protein
VLDQKNAWLNEGDQLFGRNTWVEEKEGKIYIRWNSTWKRFDLASISIEEEHQGRRVFSTILESVCADDRIEVVRVESVVNNKFYARLRRKMIPGRETRASPHEHQTVDFVKSKHKYAGRPPHDSPGWTPDDPLGDCRYAGGTPK